MSTTGWERVGPLWPSILATARCEFMRLYRIPGFSIPIIAFPVMFYALFGLPWARQHINGVDVGDYLLASFGTYAVITVALFAFGVTVSNDRASKTTLLMRATPMSPLAYLGGKIIATLFFSFVAIVALIAFAFVTHGVDFEPLTWLGLTLRLLVGVFPFITLGFAVGYLAGPNSAIAILQLINLPMSFASGLFVAMPNMPAYVRSSATFLPAFHLGELAWGAIGAPVEPAFVSIAWLGGFTVVFAVIALRAYYREETKTFG